MVKRLVLFIIASVIFFVFFNRLFLPHLSTIVTPDFGQSDVWQLNMPVKYFLWQQLHNNSLPLWNPDIGMGFPSLAEGQTGTFYIINLLAFYFLPFEIAYTTAFILTFIIAALGMYLLARKAGLSDIASIFCGFSYSLSGLFIVHMTHFNLLQTASLFPLLLYLTLKISESIDSKTNNVFIWGGLFSLVLSQQIFTGFPQLTFITLLWAIGLFLGLRIKNRKLLKIVVQTVLFFVFILLGVTIAGIQLLPQYEFFSISTRSSISADQTTYVSYPFKHLITFFMPYFIGNPKLGTYPPFYEFNGNIFWENTAYIGIFSLLLALAALFINYKYKRLFLVSLLIAFFLMTGKYSPLYFIYTIPPFSFFRVPSRFILPFTATLIIMAGGSLDFIINKIKLTKKILFKRLAVFFLFILITYQFFDIYNFYSSYHAFSKFDDVLTETQTATYLKANKSGRIFTLDDTFDQWNSIYTTKGWIDINPFFYFRNDLNPNLNTLYSIKQFQVYPVQLTKRFQYLEIAIASGVQSREGAFLLTKDTIHLLKVYGVTHIISVNNLYLENENNKIEPAFETSRFGDFKTYKIYHLGDSNFVYIATDIQKANTVEKTIGFLTSDNFKKNSVIVEDDIALNNISTNPQTEIVELENTPMKRKFSVNTNSDGLLVLSESYYPGWKGYVDSKDMQIYPVNLNSQAIKVNSGKHTVEFIYKPTSFNNGKIVTVVSLATTLLLMFVLPRVKTRIFV